MPNRSPSFALVAALVVVAVGVGCRDETPASDVRGNYDITFDDRLKIKLDIAGAKQETEGSEDGVVTFQINGQPFELDLAAFCGKEEVKCPSEVLWTKVAIDQPNIQAQNPNSHVVNVIDDRVHEPPAGVQAEAIGGLVDQYDSYTLLVGGDSRGNGDCGLLALSIATGRFTHEGEVVEEGFLDGGFPDAGPDAGPGDAGPPVPFRHVTWEPGAAVLGIDEGALRIGYLGLCAFGPAVLGATLELSTGYTGTRTGDFDPPPFTPVDPADVPAGKDGGTSVADAGDAADAGSAPVDAGSEADAGSAPVDAGTALDAGP